jgi:DNA polymerase I-like protein with 3'-5' exonuclease and polymerase domains
MSKPYTSILCLDFETRWSSKEDSVMGQYTLSKMTTEAYIRDPRFKAFGACVHEVGSATVTQWYSHYELPQLFRMYDWTKTAVLAHNAQFDVGIMSMRYGVEPCFIFDSLSMGRALRGVEVGNSLAKLAEDYSLPAKGRATQSTDGMMEIPKHVERELAEYCKHDVYLCEQVFGALMLRIDPVTRESAGAYPTKELRLIDMTVRMYTEPRLVLDKPMLEQALREDTTKLKAALVKGGVDSAELASNDQFAEVLKRMGVEPPTKISKTTGKEAYAFAKNDAMFQAMLNGDNEDVALLCEARLKVKSTMERTRAQRFIDIAERGTLPVPLSYYGAGTGRWTAAKGSNINMQNLKRGSALRKAIMAPEGMVICVGDLSQIEPRVLAWLADYDAMLDIFRAGGDPYATFGAQMFNVPGLTKETHPLLRQSAKSALLGAGYQLGWASFAAQLLVGFLGAPPVLYNKAQARQLGVTAADGEKFLSWDVNVKTMNDIPHTCTEEQLFIHCLAAKAIIEKYRAAAEPVGDFWELLGKKLETCLYGGQEYNHKGVLTFRKGEIEMVNGMCLRYPDLNLTVDRDDPKKRSVYTYADGKKRVKLYPGKICNNVTQGLARILMSDGMLRIQKRFPVKLTVHDEAGWLAREDEAEQSYKWGLSQMVVVPKWMPGIPLSADGGFHKRYGMAKN